MWSKSIVLSHVVLNTSDNTKDPVESYSSLSEYSAAFMCFSSEYFSSPLASNLQVQGGSIISVVRQNGFRHAGNFLAACAGSSSPSRFIRQQRE